MLLKQARRPTQPAGLACQSVCDPGPFEGHRACHVRYDSFDWLVTAKKTCHCGDPGRAAPSRRQGSVGGGAGGLGGRGGFGFCVIGVFLRQSSEPPQQEDPTCPADDGSGEHHKPSALIGGHRQPAATAESAITFSTSIKSIAPGCADCAPK
jgi:hypothetical protein